MLINIFQKTNLQLFLTILLVLISAKCAQIVPLTGGQKDTVPPKPVSVYPNNYSKQFNQNKIIFTFNEKIQLIQAYQNIIITPSLSKELEWKVKNKTLELLLPLERLQANTTYKIVFNKTIADLTEKNVLDNIEYIFSTGDFIDSLYVKGNIEDAYTLNHEKTVLVALYDSNKNDSIVLTENPDYFTKTDENGHYILKNLPNKSFKIFAISDNNNNLHYDPIKEKIGWTEQPIIPQKDSIVNLLVSQEKPVKNHLKKYYSPNPYQIHIIYSYPDKYYILNTSHYLMIANDSLYSDTCKVFIHNIDTATLMIQNSTQTDTLRVPVNTRKKQTLKWSIKNQLNNHQPFFLPITLESDFWIDSNEVKNKFIFYQNQDSLNPIKNIRTQINAHQITLYYPLQQNNSYTLKIPIKPIDLNDSNTYQIFQIKTNSIENYAQLKVNIIFPEKKNYIVALCNTQHKIIYSKNINLPISASNQQSIEFKNIIPDTYIIKIIQDANQNNQWDTHQFLFSQQKKQPSEKIYIYSQTIKLINNWDIVIDWKTVK